MIDNISKLKSCPDCGSDNIVYSRVREQIICRDCGLLFEPLSPDEEELFERVHGISGRKKKATKKKTAPKKPVKKAVKKKAPAKKKTRSK